MDIDLSVIVPVYNTRKYLSRCVESIVCQKNSSFIFEVILVDDGSTDGSEDLCDFFSETYTFVKVIHKGNGGPSDARNKGLLASKGKYILFVDSDDYIADGSLRKIVCCCRKQGEPDVMFLAASKVFPNGVICPLEEEMPVKHIWGKTNSEVLQYLSRRKKYPGSAWAKYVKREFLVNRAMWFEEGNKLEDLDWTMRVLVSANSFGCYNANYYYYRQGRNGSITNTFSQESYSDLKRTIDKWVREANSLKGCKSIHDAILSFAAYEYRIALLSSGAYWNRENKNWLKKHRYLLKYRKRKEDFLIKASLSLFGIRATAAFLKEFIKLRDGKQKTVRKYKRF